MADSPNLWYAVFVDPRGKQFHEDDTYRTVYFDFDFDFDFDWSHTVLDLARDALGKRYPEIADKATMIQLGPWGLSPQCRRTAHDSAI